MASRDEMTTINQLAVTQMIPSLLAAPNHHKMNRSVNKMRDVCLHCLDVNYENALKEKKTSQTITVPTTARLGGNDFDDFRTSWTTAAAANSPSSGDNDNPTEYVRRWLRQQMWRWEHGVVPCSPVIQEERTDPRAQQTERDGETRSTRETRGETDI